MNRVTIYHNPKCSKSRATLALLEQKGIAPHVIEYLKTPPTAAELNRILGLLQLEPRALMRKHEPDYHALGLDDETLTRAQLIDAMVKNPRLIERPIVLANGMAVIGRPPENVTEII
jgi:arsenate reductase (glutaredoxin)